MRYVHQSAIPLKACIIKVPYTIFVPASTHFLCVRQRRLLVSDIYVSRFNGKQVLILSGRPRKHLHSVCYFPVIFFRCGQRHTCPTCFLSAAEGLTVQSGFVRQTKDRTEPGSIYRKWLFSPGLSTRQRTGLSPGRSIGTVRSVRVCPPD